MAKVFTTVKTGCKNTKTNRRNIFLGIFFLPNWCFLRIDILKYHYLNIRHAKTRRVKEQAIGEVHSDGLLFQDAAGFNPWG